ncbi:hypothetical protein [Maritimibacter alexandrii]|uniref:hypothetical protein n=1 Tax=Maritimibacter alexandrii TaxID=2570355 RepID=UPI001107B584|nr:hypothetical protein [Maritimibacter alexandrii]
MSRADFLTRLARLPRAEWFDAFQGEAQETGGRFEPFSAAAGVQLHGACVATTGGLERLYDLWIARAAELENVAWARAVLLDLRSKPRERRKAARMVIANTTDRVARVRARHALTQLGEVRP